MSATAQFTELSHTNLPNKRLDATGTAVHLVECHLADNLVAITPVNTRQFGPIAVNVLQISVYSFGMN
jgi:hypothetical protein